MSKISRDKKKKKEPWKICQDCGEKFPLRKLFQGKDPYVSEIHGDEEAEEVCICQKCYKERVWDT
jgi:hypothetical protein